MYVPFTIHGVQNAYRTYCELKKSGGQIRDNEKESE
jgi:hypothetical protein